MGIVNRRQDQPPVFPFGGQEHSPALFAPDFHGLQVGHHHDAAADELLRAVMPGDAGDNLPLLLPQGDAQLEQLVGARYFLSRQHLGHAQVHLLKIIERDHILGLLLRLLHLAGDRQLLQARERDLTLSKERSRTQPAPGKIVQGYLLRPDHPAHGLHAAGHHRVQQLGGDTQGLGGMV
ncbi:hypothetical protein ES703_102909 [subsurface metagenome]